MTFSWGLIEWLASAGVMALLLGITLAIFQPPGLLVRIPGAIFLAKQDWKEGHKRLAITLDDGPDPNTTPRILAVLNRHHAPATFFLIGERALANPALVRQIVAEGHEIGNHSFSEELSLCSGNFGDALKRTETVFHRILGPDFKGAIWVRPGGGFYNIRMTEVARSCGYQAMVLGSLFPLDTHIRSVEFSAGFILSRIHPGAIIILHDSRGKRETYDDRPRGERTAETLDRIIPRLQEQSYQFLTLDHLLNDHELTP